MAKKYDTNPLDPDFPRKVAEQGQQTATMPSLRAESTTLNDTATAREEPTRRYENGSFAQYQSVYSEPQGPPPAVYQTTRLEEAEKPGDRKVLGIHENILMILRYAPFYIGLVAGLLELLFVPKSETKVRFHAAQGMALYIAILIVSTFLGVIGNFSDWADVGQLIFNFAAGILLVVSMIQVWQGKPVHFESLDSLANWLNEKIKS